MAPQERPSQFDPLVLRKPEDGDSYKRGWQNGSPLPKKLLEGPGLVVSRLAGFQVTQLSLPKYILLLVGWALSSTATRIPEDPLPLLLSLHQSAAVFTVNTALLSSYGLQDNNPRQELLKGPCQASFSRPYTNELDSLSCSPK